MGTMSTVRTYAGVVGVVLLLLGVVGLIMQDAILFGFLNSDIIEDIIHLVTGALMAYVGFAQRDNALARMVVGVLGAIYLLVGVLGFLDAKLFGIVPTGYTTPDNIVHLLLGVLGLVVAYALPTTDTTVTT
ncbi:MAG TPA: DUF4383 domain-containing protein [Chloroflexia bacterium]|nr:DUF4383 domain-containing protein [Chloroflexia bacterium]